MSYSEENGQVGRWKKWGVRSFRVDSDDYNAIIFGAPAPQTLWAWGVWAHEFRAIGIEYSLTAARRAATAKILELPRKR